MIKYGELVEYIKRNHVNWNTDLFDVLREFFEEYSHNYSPLPPPPSSPLPQSSQPTVIIPRVTDFKEPDGGEYSTQDVFDLFST